MGNKDLRKAVKAKEKAAKKARKAKKKKTGKKDDLFDPENLAKFKAELEERKRREAEFAAQAADSDSDKDSDKGDIKFILDTQNENNSAQSSKAVTPVQLQSPLEPIKTQDTEDWKNFLALTGGIDSIIKQKKEELEDIKVDSYFQKKSSEVTEDGETTEKPKKKAKKWVDLDKEGFDDI